MQDCERPMGLVDRFGRLLVIHPGIILDSGGFIRREIDPLVGFDRCGFVEGAIYEKNVLGNSEIGTQAQNDGDGEPLDFGLAGTRSGVGVGSPLVLYWTERRLGIGHFSSMDEVSWDGSTAGAGTAGRAKGHTLELTRFGGQVTSAVRDSVAERTVLPTNISKGAFALVVSRAMVCGGIPVDGRARYCGPDRVMDDRSDACCQRRLITNAARSVLAQVGSPA